MIVVKKKLQFFKSKLIAILITSLLAASVSTPLLSSEVTYSSIRVSPYDGRNKGKDYTGAWVYLSNVKINGKPQGTVAFEFGGNYSKQRVSSIGLSSRRTFPDLRANLADRSDGGDVGNRFWISQNDSKLRRLYNGVSEISQVKLKAICGAMSDESFVTQIISRMAKSERYGDQYKRYWKDPYRVMQVKNIAGSCNVKLNNLQNKILFVKEGSSGSSTTGNNSNKVCGLATSFSTVSNSRLRIIQSGLKKRGLYSGAIDGVMGKGSCAGFAKFMKCEARNSNIFTSREYGYIKLAPSKKVEGCYNPEPSLRYFKSLW